jgi:tetratricopeptide (TPR) repeat protein
MEPKRVIFVSAVSNEFHNAPPEQRHIFKSYRDVLKQAFRMVAPHYEVIVQEDLPQGLCDLLETLDHEIARSLFVIHLVGDLAGFLPEPGPLRSLHIRHPDLLAGVPELLAAVGEGAGITYTQWELYLAFHSGIRRLIFEAGPDAPRSPLCAPTPADQTSQAAHRRRIEATGVHRGPFQDQGDVARKSIRSFLHFRVDPTVDPEETSADALAEAWSHQEEIVEHLASAIKKPDPRAVAVTDPANVAAFVAAVRSAAKRWQVNLATVVDIAGRHEEQLRAAAEHRPTPEALYDQGFAELALGDYTAARFTARRAADLALELRQQQPDDEPFHREAAQNSLLLLHEAAKAAHDTPVAIAAMEEAGALVDKEADPLLWAEIHEPLARFLLGQAKLERADDLISDLIDIREAHQGGNHPALARTLLLWSRLLHARANWSGMEGVAARAERIFACQNPPDLPGVASAIGNRAVALSEENRNAEAELLMRRALAISEKGFGLEHPDVATRLNNLATLLQATNRLGEAEPLMRRALDIGEKSFGPEHPTVAIRLNNLADMLRATNRLGEAEPLMRRALAIDEKSFGPGHPTVAVALNNLAQLLEATNRLGEAEPMYRRALAIDEKSFGPEHPTVAVALNNLVALLQATNRLGEAEPLMRRALAIGERSFGPEHPTVAVALNNLAQLLKATNRSGEAEPLMRRALAIDEKSSGPEHPHVATRLNNLAQLLEATNRLGEAEPLMRRALAIDERSFGPEHPKVAVHLSNLASLLQDTNRLGEAEPLMRRALAIDEMSFGPEHPNVAIRLNNLTGLLKATSRPCEAEPLIRRALAIDEKSFGPEHPNIARDLNNLAQLLQAANRLGEAEPMMRRALDIFLQFTRTTGHQHPHLQAAINNYGLLLLAMGRTEEEIRAQLRGIAPEFFRE